jgi:cytochrome oxidase Cu insertion factor (SCO1/SenC/PrrC family)
LNKKISFAFLMFLSILLIGCTQVTDAENNGLADANPGLEDIEDETIKEESFSSAPLFETQTIDGTVFSLEEEISNEKPTVVYFMASWCPQCAQNWAGINEAVKKYEDKVNFIAISVDPTDDKETLRNILETNDYDFNMVEGSPQLVGLYKVKGQTERFSIDKSGNIVAQGKGVLSEQEWDDLFNSLI